jgi:hypothetical protein
MTSEMTPSSLATHHDFIVSPGQSLVGAVGTGHGVERFRLRPARRDRYSDNAVDGPGRNDSMLRLFLDAPSHAAADPLLAELLEQHARPLLTQILRRKLAVSAPTVMTHDVDEVAAEGVANILARLLDLRSGRNPEPIESFRGYVAVVAYNGWHRHLRERFPVRARLKNRLRYVLSRHPALALWTDGGVALCAVRRSQGNPVSASATRRLNDGIVQRDRFDREVFAEGRPEDEAEVAAAIVAWVGGPVALDDVVAATGTLLGVTDVAAARSTEGRDEQTTAIQNVPDHSPSALTAITEREDLARLWTEIQTLPVRQRCALLLNLRDDEGRGVIGLLPFTGTASIRQIADTLEMPHSVLAGLWRELPLEDAVIAERLGLTRQQVINLRKSARARLARRTRTPSSCGAGR